MQGPVTLNLYAVIHTCTTNGTQVLTGQVAYNGTEWTEPEMANANAA
jgi:hypothetical protein